MNQFHDLMVSKGFHDDDTFDADGLPDARTRIVFAGLIVTEWREQQADAASEPKWCLREGGKPCGELSEWVDIWLRCADALGACREPLDGKAVDLLVEGERSGSLVCWAVAVAIEAARKGDRGHYAEALRAIMKYCVFRGCLLRASYPDLPKFGEAVAAKHAYNATRPHRHGGKLA